MDYTKGIWVVILLCYIQDSNVIGGSKKGVVWILIQELEVSLVTIDH